MWNILTQGLLVIATICCVKFLKWELCLPWFEGELQLKGLLLMITTYVVIYLVWMFVWHFFLQREIPLTLLVALKDILPFAFLATLSMVITYYLTRGIENIYILLIVRILIAAVIYLGTVWLTGAKILRESLAFLKGKKKRSD